MSLADKIEQYEYLRLLLLGSEAGVGLAQPRLNPGAEGFDAFVSTSYVALRETLAEDASFFSRVGVLARHQAPRSVYLLRTARQHDDNLEAVVFYDRWVGDEPIDWDNAVERLAEQVEDYLGLMIQAARSVRQSGELHRQWADSASVSVSTVFASVCQDLVLAFPSRAREAKVRAIEGRYRRERQAGPKRRVIADLCVQEALSESGGLPVDYAELLDELGLLGTRDAPAVLALAYATSRAHPNLNGDDFKRKTSEMWWSLVSS